MSTTFSNTHLLLIPPLASPASHTDHKPTGLLQLMDLSFGSDGERGECQRTPPQTPTDSEPDSFDSVGHNNHATNAALALIRNLSPLNLVSKPQRPSSLPFSIDNILRPDFGSPGSRSSDSSSVGNGVSDQLLGQFSTNGPWRHNSTLMSPISPFSAIINSTAHGNLSAATGSMMGLGSLASGGGSGVNVGSLGGWRAIKSDEGSPPSKLGTIQQQNDSSKSPPMSPMSSASSSCSGLVSPSASVVSSAGTALTSSPTPGGTPGAPNGQLWPAWVYCTRYSDRPSSGPRCRRVKSTKNHSKPKPVSPAAAAVIHDIPAGGGKLGSGLGGSPAGGDDKRPRTAFTPDQLQRLKDEFNENRYLTEKRRQDLAQTLGLKESQIKIWFQNKRAKIKKQTGPRNPLALSLMAQGLYNHSTTVLSDEELENN